MLDQCEANLNQVSGYIDKWDSNKPYATDLELILIKIGLVNGRDKLNEKKCNILTYLRHEKMYDDGHAEDKLRLEGDLVRVSNLLDRSNNLIEDIDNRLGVHFNTLSNDDLFKYALAIKGGIHG